MQVGKAMARMQDRLNVGKVVLTPNKDSVQSAV